MPLRAGILNVFGVNVFICYYCIMFQKGNKYGLLLIVFFLIIINIFLIRLDWQGSKRSLTFAMLDIGQGDGLFIESPTGTQIMFDAGPPRKILQQLSSV